MTKIKILVHNIKNHQNDMQTTVNNIYRQQSKALETGDTDYWDAVAANLVSFYTSSEKIFRLVADNLDYYLPQGADWHIQLLDQMVISTEDRPALLREFTRQKLDQCRGFWHFFMNNYELKLRYDKIQELTSNLLETWDFLCQDINRFCDFLDYLEVPHSREIILE